MKWHQTLALLLVGLTFTTACSYNKPDEPTLRSDARQLTPTHTIAQLKALYTGAPTRILQDVVVEAVMASDDTEGNLYRSCYIQDETGGIELKLSMGNMSTLYSQGSKVYLCPRDMTLGCYADQINLGYRSLEAKYETAFYPEKLVPSVLLRTGSEAKLEPRVLTIATLSPRYAGMLVRLDGVQFVDGDLGQTYAAPENRKQQGNVNRTLIDRSGKTLIVRTSSYAKFAGRKVPEGSGSITAILSYYRDTPQLLLLREGDARLDNPRF